MVGTTVEWYDFFVYATVAAMVFNDHYFNVLTNSPFAAKIVGFATVGISFLFRPLGAVVAGHYGDKLGRKAMLVVTLVLMGAATTLIGVIPSAESIGIAAPLLIMLMRVIQGFSAGGEWGGAALMAVEHAPANKRGFFGAFPQIGVPVGMVISTLMLLLMMQISGDDFVTWGWRVPFLISALLVVFGMWIRMGVAESPVMNQIVEEDDQVSLPIVEMFKTSWKQLIVGSLVFAGNGVAGYLSTGGFLAAYLKDSPEKHGLGLNPKIALLVIASFEVCRIFTILFSAWASDRIGRKKMYIIGFVLEIILAFVFFWLLNTAASGDKPNYLLVVLAVVLFSIPAGFTYGPQAAFFAELFPARIRYSGAAIAYAIGAVIGGAFASMIAAALLEWSNGNNYVVGVYVATMATIALIAALFIKDRTGKPLDGDHDTDVVSQEIHDEIDKDIEEGKSHPVSFDRPGF
ncbi:MAG: MHS family MFS transporter [Actinomycetaceae bacterium]|nr:MHS family MFS transporter [Actinomycetaceae bacterium]